MKKLPKKLRIISKEIDKISSQESEKLTGGEDTKCKPNFTCEPNFMCFPFNY